MIDPASGQFSFPLSAMAEVDAREVIGRVLTDDIAPLRDRVTTLLSGLLESGDTPPIMAADEIVNVKVDRPVRARFEWRSRTPDRESCWEASGGNAALRRKVGAHISSAGRPTDGASSPAQEARGSGSSSTFHSARRTDLRTERLE